MELKLSNEQIELAAAEAMMAFNAIPKTEGICEITVLRNSRMSSPWMDAMRHAAPYLQAPLAEPTKKEIEQFKKDYSGCLDPSILDSMGRALGQFVARRNHPPSDPRQDAIARVIHQHDLKSPQEIASLVLAALDALEVQK